MSLAGWKVEARRRERLLARALGGRTEALRELAKIEDSPAEEWRVWPALAIRADASGLMEPEGEPFARWRRALRASAARVLLFEATLSSLARLLDREGVR